MGGGDNEGEVEERDGLGRIPGRRTLKVILSDHDRRPKKRNSQLTLASFPPSPFFLSSFLPFLRLSLISPRRSLRSLSKASRLPAPLTPSSKPRSFRKDSSRLCNLVRRSDMLDVGGRGWMVIVVGAGFMVIAEVGVWV